METKYKVVLAVGAVATAFAAGRYTTPVKIKTETKIVEVEKKVKDKTTDTNKKKHRTTTTVEITKPNGEKEKTTTTTVDTTTDKKTDTTTTTTTDTTSNTKTETTKQSGHLTLSLLGGASFFTPGMPFVYGLSVEKSLIGPVNVGLWGLNTGVLGASVGLTF